MTMKQNSKSGLILTFLSFFISVLANAQSTSKFLNEKPKDLIVSGYIICSVIVFGILIFAISKIASKYSKEGDESSKKTNRFISRRHRRHQKAIKKTP